MAIASIWPGRAFDVFVVNRYFGNDKGEEFVQVHHERRCSVALATAEAFASRYVGVSYSDVWLDGIRCLWASDGSHGEWTSDYKMTTPRAPGLYRWNGEESPVQYTRVPFGNR